MSMTAQEITGFLHKNFPQAYENGQIFNIESVTPHKVRLRQVFSSSQLRPGGTISGPTMMALADFAFYIAILGALGPVALAVTTNFNINFLRKPEPMDLIAEAQILKMGKRLAVGHVYIFSDGNAEPVAHASMTYSIPPPAA